MTAPGQTPPGVAHDCPNPQKGWSIRPYKQLDERIGWTLFNREQMELPNLVLRFCPWCGDPLPSRRRVKAT